MPPFSSSLNRLFSAAVASSRFRHLLLTDPITALSNGYNGESFSLTQDEFAHVIAIQATSLREFAAQLIKRFQLAEDATTHPARSDSTAVANLNEVGKAQTDGRAMVAKKLTKKKDIARKEIPLKRQ